LRITQEAVNNALKHGAPGAIEIRIDRRPGEWSLMIEDDGAGIAEPTPAGEGLGLRLMRYRAAVIGGRFEIGRSARRGTIVTCRFSSGSEGSSAPGDDMTRRPARAPVRPVDDRPAEGGR
jgi:signal transduction histidine kinase